MTVNQRDIIERYVDERYFDKEKLYKYLSRHKIVGNEVFSYVNKDYSQRNRTFPWLDAEDGYTPIEKTKFIKRIPFFFYIPDREKNQVGDLGCYISGLIEDRDGTGRSLEELYATLEELLYTYGISLDDIMNYTVEQTGYVSRTDLLFQWAEYIKLCNKFSLEDKTPDNFIYRYNEFLEKAGKSPVIYEIQEMFMGDYFYRYGDQIEFEGVFPCDNSGIPIMKWIGLKIKNSGQISFIKDEDHSRGRLIVQLKPNTLIHALNCHNYGSAEDIWFQIYAGPQLMEFDYNYLKEKRLKMKYTQQKVADAIETSIRTYQKWENGETTPDGHNLLRLMNFLDIPDVQNLIKYSNEA